MFQTVWSASLEEIADKISKTVRTVQRVKVFFSEIYPKQEYKAFLCYSWILYPPILEKLSEKSNIKQFTDKFSIIGNCPDSE